jgi:hypothetical protein
MGWLETVPRLPTRQGHGVYLIHWGGDHDWAMDPANLSDLSASLRHDSNDDYYYPHLNYLLKSWRCVRE